MPKIMIRKYADGGMRQGDISPTVGGGMFVSPQSQTIVGTEDGLPYSPMTFSESTDGFIDSLATRIMPNGALAVVGSTESIRDTYTKAAVYLFQRSPLFAKVVSYIVDAVYGSGFRLIAEPSMLSTAKPSSRSVELAQNTLDTLWKTISPSLYFAIQDSIMLGELLYRAVEIGGAMTVEHIPPQYISSVAGHAMPKVVGEPVSGYPWEPEYAYVTGLGKPISILRMEGTGDVAAADLPAGFYFPVRKLSSVPGGAPMLLPSMDWISLWNRSAKTELSRSGISHSIYWDVELQGMSDAQIREWLRTPAARPPDPGGTFAHNERAHWSLVVPDIDADAFGMSDMYRKTLLRLTGVIDEEKSTSERGEALDPATRALQVLQARLSAFYKGIGEAALSVADIKGRESIAVSCETSQLGFRDFQRSSGALLRVASALKTMTLDIPDCMTPAQAAAIFDNALTMLGIKAD